MSRSIDYRLTTCKYLIKLVQEKSESIKTDETKTDLEKLIEYKMLTRAYNELQRLIDNDPFFKTHLTVIDLSLIHI